MSAPAPAPALLPTDVLVLGSGPAGSAAAALLARQGLAVTVLAGAQGAHPDSAAFLPPGAMPLLEQLGVREMVLGLPHTQAVGAVAVAVGGPAAPALFPFAAALDGGLPDGAVVLRGELDAALLAHAQRLGAEVRPRWVARAPLWEGARLVGVVAANPAGVERRILARATLDATGLASFLATRMGWRFGYPRYRKVALQALFQGEGHGGLALPGTVGYLRVDGGWVRHLPLRGGLRGVAAVLDQASLPGTGLGVPEVLAALRRACGTAACLPAGDPATAAVQRNFAHRVLRVAGDGFCLLGDAAGYFDPLGASGVLVALATAATAAQDVGEALARHGRVDAADFGPTIAVTRQLHRLAFALSRAFHDPRFLPLLVQPPQAMRLRGGLVSLLGGDVTRGGLWRRSVRLRALHLWARLAGRRAL